MLSHGIPPVIVAGMLGHSVGFRTENRRTHSQNTLGAGSTQPTGSISILLTTSAYSFRQ